MLCSDRMLLLSHYEYEAMKPYIGVIPAEIWDTHVIPFLLNSAIYWNGLVYPPFHKDKDKQWDLNSPAEDGDETEYHPFYFEEAHFKSMQNQLPGFDLKQSCFIAPMTGVFEFQFLPTFVNCGYSDRECLQIIFDPGGTLRVSSLCTLQRRTIHMSRGEIIHFRFGTTKLGYLASFELQIRFLTEKEPALRDSYIVEPRLSHF